MYKYEMHLHTAEGSACARNTGGEMARGAKRAGYSGIFVTDHFFNGNCAVCGSYSWRERVRLFMRGYESAKREGDKIGLDVYFGLEYGLQGNDFLIYNFSGAQIAAYPEIMADSFEQMAERVRGEGGFIVHAHPFRYASYIPYVGRVFPEHTDAVEVANAAHNKSGREGESYDRKAREYARAHNLPGVGGSDTHSAEFIEGGVAFCRKPESLEHLMGMVRQGEHIILGGHEADD